MRKALALAAAASLVLVGCGDTVVEDDTTAAAAAPAAKDLDGDGVPDTEDYAPNDPTIQSRDDIDTDGDGVPDYQDDFPKNAKYSKDSDGDRVADDVDDYPNDPDRSKALTRADFKAVGDREWALIVKDPDAHIGDRVIVYADVFQFDAATGDDTFLAYADDAQWYDSWEFDDNTMFIGTKKKFANVVEDDLIKVWGTVMGSFSYDTQIGGNTTVPMIMVEFIEVYGQS